MILTPEGMLVDASSECLAGASFPLSKGIETMSHCGACTHGEAVVMASGTVASVLRLADRGWLRKGQRADLVLYRLINDGMRIEETWIEGKKAYASEHSGLSS